MRLCVVASQILQNFPHQRVDHSIISEQRISQLRFGLNTWTWLKLSTAVIDERPHTILRDLKMKL